ncbi:MAG: response regulator [bacterium]|nr:response regulator [bacterium]
MPKEGQVVLIVEDEVPLRSAIVTKLKAEGFHTLEADNGVEGLRLAKEKHPQLILLDILMPKMHGLEMLSKLRLDEWGRGVPVIVLTNLNETTKVAEAAEGKVIDFMIKSDWKLSDVVDKVKKKLQAG